MMPNPDQTRSDLAVRRKQAKTGMAVALGVLAGTGFLARRPGVKTAHIVAGVALIGLSYWHWSLYAHGGQGGRQGPR